MSRPSILSVTTEKYRQFYTFEDNNLQHKFLVELSKNLWKAYKNQYTYKTFETYIETPGAEEVLKKTEYHLTSIWLGYKLEGMR